MREYSNYGNIFHNQGEPKAIDLYSKAIKLNPSFAMAHFNLGLYTKRMETLKKPKNLSKDY